MSGAADFLDAERIIARSFVRYVELYDSIHSTNDRGIQLVRQASLATPALIAARRQTAGRGRSGRSWWSAEGSLTFSLVLDAAAWELAQRDWPRLSLTTALAICDALRDEVPDASPAIKWPNDVLIDDGKIAGILIESPGGAAQVDLPLVVGVGINVNNSWHAAPREAGPDGITLCEVSGRPHELQSVLEAFLQAFERRLHQLTSSDPQLARDWQRLCRLTGRVIEVHSDNVRVEGRCRGISVDGALLVEGVTRINRVYSGSVRIASSDGKLGVR